jgi:hypothetical protein
MFDFDLRLAHCTLLLLSTQALCHETHETSRPFTGLRFSGDASKRLRFLKEVRQTPKPATRKQF